MPNEGPPGHEPHGTSTVGSSTRHPWAHMGPMQEAVAVVCSAVELLAAALVLGYPAATRLLAFAGPAQQYYEWAATPALVVAALLAVTAAGVLAWLRFGPRRPRSRTVVAGGMAVALVAGGTGAFAMHVRATPKGSLLGAVQQLKAPAGTAHDRVSYGLVPVDGSLVADGPDSSGRSSGAVRSWQVPQTPGACDWTWRVALAWADGGSLTALPVTRASGAVCQWSARKDGWGGSCPSGRRAGPRATGL
jgi:hypothetical protein